LEFKLLSSASLSELLSSKAAISDSSSKVMFSWFGSFFFGFFFFFKWLYWLWFDVDAKEKAGVATVACAAEPYFCFGGSNYYCFYLFFLSCFFRLYGIRTLSFYSLSAVVTTLSCENVP
jgi:hypothetical protein